MVTLESEFLQYKMLHMVSILKAKMIDYYRTLEQNKVLIPDFMRQDTPEKLADKEVKNLFYNDLNKFLSLYERAYQELAERAEF